MATRRSDWEKARDAWKARRAEFAFHEDVMGYSLDNVIDKNGEARLMVNEREDVPLSAPPAVLARVMEIHGEFARWNANECDWPTSRGGA